VTGSQPCHCCKEREKKSTPPNQQFSPTSSIALGHITFSGNTDFHSFSTIVGTFYFHATHNNLEHFQGKKIQQWFFLEDQLSFVYL